MRARARAQVAQPRFRLGGKAEVDSPPAGSQVRARSRYTRTRLASAGVPGGARRKPRTNVDTKPRPELLRTTVQRACVPRPDHGGPRASGPDAQSRFRFRRWLAAYAARHVTPRARSRHTVAGEDRDPTNSLAGPQQRLTDGPDWSGTIARRADSFVVIIVTSLRRSTISHVTLREEGSPRVRSLRRVWETDVSGRTHEKDSG